MTARRNSNAAALDIVSAISDPHVFGPFFRGATWDAWRAFFAALFALPMSAAQVAIYREHTQRTAPPTAPADEAWLVIGRRGGKSFALATVAVFLACFRDWRPYLGPGERGTIMIIARDRRQARVIKRFVVGLLHSVPMLKAVIEEERVEVIELKRSVSIEIHTASFRSTRGYTVIAALLDELAFWPTDEDAGSPDTEVINAIRPGMATIPGSVLLCASSPHARRGALWDAHRKHFGQDGDSVLVWQAATRAMNPTVPQAFIDKHVAEDPSRASAEYGACFRVDLEAFVSREVIDACVIMGRRELPRIDGVHYTAFVDPSGGSADAMTLAICHVEGTRAVLDVVRERKPPFSPDSVVMEFAELLKAYGVSSVRGDRYAGEWPRERFSVHGINYIPAAKPKSDIYVALLPILNSGRCELLDHPRLVAQLLGLERSTARGGRDSIDHAPGAHDDIANAVAGAITSVLGGERRELTYPAPFVHSVPRAIPGGSVAPPAVYAQPQKPQPAPAASDAAPLARAPVHGANWYWARGLKAPVREVPPAPNGPIPAPKGHSEGWSRMDEPWRGYV